uniref:ATP synthase F0 subunit 8 n=1 Tax=Herdmania momus TaxID=7733 RepID=D1GKX9_HERMO|nr:ATP synthase F0 subunit 8 [Herdmania momus]CAX65558.1 ATP synthase F0 subunit 8 [Herdmania momus]
MPQINLGSFFVYYVVFFGFFLYNVMYSVNEVFGK